MGVARDSIGATNSRNTVIHRSKIDPHRVVRLHHSSSPFTCERNSPVIAGDLVSMISNKTQHYTRQTSTLSWHICMFAYPPCSEHPSCSQSSLASPVDQEHRPLG